MSGRICVVTCFGETQQNNRHDREMAVTESITPKPADSFRIIHTADWHLGKLLNEQSREEEHSRFLSWLLTVVAEHEVDAILLAGDVFDTANPPQSAIANYFNFVSGLFRQRECSLVVIAGNHDSAAQLEAPKRALSALNTHVAGFLAKDPSERILCLPDKEHPKVAIALMPFLRDRDLRVGNAGETADEIRAKVVAGIGQRYAEAAEAAVSLGLECPVLATGHLTVTGSTPSDSERDIHIGGLGEVNCDIFPEQFSYIALGHLHRPQATDANQRVRYAGSPIPLSFSEVNDVKELRILDVTDNGITQQRLSVPVYRRLSQIRTTNAQLEQAIEEFDPDPGELRTWVEVVVKDAVLEDDLNERVRELSANREFDVLKVLREKPVTVTGLHAGDSTDDEVIESLIDSPGEVFEHLLGEHEHFSEQEIQALRTAFAVLVDRDAQSESGDAP